MSSINTDDVAKTLEAIAKAIDSIAKEIADFDDVFLKARRISELSNKLFLIRLKSVKLVTKSEYGKIRDFMFNASTYISKELYINENRMIELYRTAPCDAEQSSHSILDAVEGHRTIAINLVKINNDGISINNVRYKCEDVEIILDASYGLYLKIRFASKSSLELRFPIYDEHIEDSQMHEILTILLSRDLVNRIIEVLNAYAEHLHRVKPTLMNKLHNIEDRINNAIVIVQAVIDAFNELTRKTEAIENL